jgi:hypothetical protein
MTAATLRFHRALSDIIRDLDRESSPDRYDRLLGEWVAHPEVIAQQAEYDTIDALLAEQVPV